MARPTPPKPSPKRPSQPRTRQRTATPHPAGTRRRGPRPLGPRPTRVPISPPPSMSGPQRLQKLLSQAGIASRRAAEEMIQSGRVQVNAQTVTALGIKADPRTDRITVDGRPLRPAAPFIYILLHKPTYVVTTLFDPEGRPTVRDLLPKLRERVFPVGRLDFHSAGLLLLTNDGELALRLTHPRYGIRKTYRVKVKGVPTPETLDLLARGVRLAEGTTAPAEVRVERSRDDKTWLELTLGEGRKREVRRMCEEVGHPVEKLVRVQLGPLSLGKLPPGGHRPLTARELRALRRAVGLPDGG